MSIEDKIQALIVAIEANTQALLGKDNIKAVKVEAVKAVEIEVIDTKPVTIDDVSLKLTELLQSKGRDVAVQILGKHSAKKVSDVKDLNAFMADVLKALEA